MMAAARRELLVELSGDVRMPIIGVGTWQMRDRDALYGVLDEALRVGYRLIDTAAAYANERAIGDALRTLLPKHNLRRSDIFITSKLSTVDQGAGRAYEAALRSLENLGGDYLDLYIIHFPGARGIQNQDPALPELRKGSWLDLEKLKSEGRFRAIGVSNYTIRHLEEMKTYATTSCWPPALNQCEYHPYYKPDELIRYCRERGVHFQAYSSLGGAAHKHELMTDPTVVQLSAQYGCSPTQILLAWAINQGISVLPKTSQPQRVAHNFESTRIQMKPEDVQKLAGCLGTSKKFSWDPDVVL